MIVWFKSTEKTKQLFNYIPWFKIPYRNSFPIKIWCLLTWVAFIFTKLLCYQKRNIFVLKSPSSSFLLSISISERQKTRRFIPPSSLSCIFSQCNMSLHILLVVLRTSSLSIWGFTFACYQLNRKCFFLTRRQFAPWWVEDKSKPGFIQCSYECLIIATK